MLECDSFGVSRFLCSALFLIWDFLRCDCRPVRCVCMLAFRDCSRLSDLVVPAGIAIGERAFEGCSNVILSV
jgi:hypothetical protein